MAPTLPLEGRVALVTGAGRGLGRAYARAFAALGARVVVNNRSADPAAAVAEEIRADGGEATACPGDLGSPGAAQRAVDGAIDAYGRLDIVVNNAGGIETPAGSFTEISAADRDALMRQNFTTAWDVTAAAWPHLEQAGYGRIVLCGSPLSLAGSPGYAHYAAAKSALIGLARTLAVEGAEHGITTNVLLPVGDTRKEPPTTDAERWFARTITVDHVAAALSWLVDERCTANGEIFAVAGPRIARTYVAETAGFVAHDEPFSRDTIAARFERVFDEQGSHQFATMAAVMTHWGTTFDGAAA